MSIWPMRELGPTLRFVGLASRVSARKDNVLNLKKDMALLIDKIHVKR
jgi:hypothetical protein